MGNLPSKPIREAMASDVNLVTVIAMVITARNNFSRVSPSNSETSRRWYANLTDNLTNYCPDLPVVHAPLSTNEATNYSRYWRATLLFLLDDPQRPAIMLSLYQTTGTPLLLIRVMAMINSNEIYCCYQDVTQVTHPTLLISEETGITEVPLLTEVVVFGTTLPELKIN